MAFLTGKDICYLLRFLQFCILHLVSGTFLIIFCVKDVRSVPIFICSSFSFISNSIRFYFTAKQTKLTKLMQLPSVVYCADTKEQSWTSAQVHLVSQSLRLFTVLYSCFGYQSHFTALSCLFPDTQQVLNTSLIK